MAPASYSRSLASAFKRLKLSTPTRAAVQHTRHITSSSRNAAPETASPSSNASPLELANIRLPKAVQATYLAPLRRPSTHGITSADLQLRSYSVRNLELFADFAMRAAYFLNLPTRGPRPLPRITERWAVPRSNFVHKKSQENFERITLRRMIRIVDASPRTVAHWLAFLRKHQYYGVGLRANVWEAGSLDAASELDAQAAEMQKAMEQGAEGTGEFFEKQMEVFTYPDTDGWSVKGTMKGRKLATEPFKAQWGGHGPMGGASSVKDSRHRVLKPRGPDGVKLGETTRPEGGKRTAFRGKTEAATLGDEAVAAEEKPASTTEESRAPR